MPASKIKNLCLIILLLCNLCLLILLVPTRLADSRQAARTAEQLRQLYDANGIHLPVGTLPESRRLYTLEAALDREAALTAARALLGADVSAEEDSGSYQAAYTSDLGTCSIRRSQLDAQLTGRTVNGSPRKAAKELLRQMGLSCDELTEQNTEDGLTAVQTHQTIRGMSVFSAELTFRFDGSRLESVSGSFCPVEDTLTALSRETCISCADALVAFLEERTAIGWVGSAVLSIRQGYLIADSASASTLRLLPVWRLETDTAVVYINGITRELMLPAI